MLLDSPVMSNISVGVRSSFSGESGANAAAAANFNIPGAAVVSSR